MPAARPVGWLASCMASVACTHPSSARRHLPPGPQPGARLHCQNQPLRRGPAGLQPKQQHRRLHLRAVPRRCEREIGEESICSLLPCSPSPDGVSLLARPIPILNQPHRRQLRCKASHLPCRPIRDQPHQPLPRSALRRLLVRSVGCVTPTCCALAPAHGPCHGWLDAAAGEFQPENGFTGSSCQRKTATCGQGQYVNNYDSRTSDYRCSACLPGSAQPSSSHLTRDQCLGPAGVLLWDWPCLLRARQADLSCGACSLWARHTPTRRWPGILPGMWARLLHGRPQPDQLQRCAELAEFLFNACFSLSRFALR